MALNPARSLPAERPTDAPGVAGRRSPGRARRGPWLAAMAWALAWWWVVTSGQAAEVTINELMYHPPSGQPQDEWIELFNPATNAVRLLGWRFDAGVRFTFPDVSLPPGGYLVVAASTNAFRTHHPTVPHLVGDWQGTLANGGQAVELVDATGRRVEQVRYADDGDWALRRVAEPFPGQTNWWPGWGWVTTADGGGHSLERRNPSLRVDSGQNWGDSESAGGTPGAVNSLRATDLAPLILEVAHRPAVPHSNQAVTVTARVVDESPGPWLVTLHHRVDGTTNFASVPMWDDGAHGDGVAADGVYGAVLPPQPDLTVIEFFVAASDAGGRARTWPGPTDADGAQGANALYQVDDLAYPGTQPIYRVIVPAAEWRAWLDLMDNVSNGRHSDAAMHGAFVSVDGLGTEIRYQVSVRNRGKGTRAARPHNLHVSFPATRPWRGRTALALNTRTVHSQVAGNVVHSIAALPNTHGAPVQVRINGANLARLAPNGSVDSFQFGSYYAFQPYNSEWAQDHFPLDPNGNVYSGTWYYRWVRLDRPADLSYLGEDPAAYRQALSPTGPSASTGPYDKGTHAALDDWSDLIELTRVLNESTDEAYVEAVRRVVDVDEWLRYFAVTSLIGNMETTLGTGAGDDFSLYRGGVDRRFRILPHDMDTTLGQGDAGPDYTRSIFRATTVPAINRFLKHPAFAPRYFATLKALADSTFAAAQLEPVLDRALGGWVPATYLDSMKAFAAQRRSNVLAQIPMSLSVTSALPVVSGYLHTTNTVATLGGHAHAIHTRSVRVNGAPAAWTAWTASWQADAVPLQPGLNRVLVQSFDEQERELARGTADLWCERGPSLPIAGGTLETNLVWTRAGGPYRLGGTLTVPAGRTLTIEPGTTVYLDSGVDLVVAQGGRLLAEGTATQSIMFSSPPGSGTSWGGLTLAGAAGSPESRLAHVVFAGNGTTCLQVSGGTVDLDHLAFLTTTHQYLSLDNASFVVRDCVFPTATAPFELVHGTGGLQPGGRGLFLRNFFGAANGYNDVVDFTGGSRASQPIVQFIRNVFTGASDDHLDLDGTDAWVEGNLFLHVHKNGSPDTASGVSGGDASGRTSEITLVGNLFYDCDQAVMAKQGNFYTLLNNTIVRQTHTGGLDTDGAVVCLADEGTTEGAGMYLEGNVVADAEQLVRNLTAATLTFTNNLLPFAWTGPGGGNVNLPPGFHHVPRLEDTFFTSYQDAQIMWEWFGLRPGSPARGTGPNGQDRGAAIPLGVSIQGVPAAPTRATSATLHIGHVRRGAGVPTGDWPEGAGYVRYRYRLDAGDWSAVQPLETPIVLTNLADGPHAIEVVGLRDSNLWQDDPVLGPDARVTRSATWTVDPTLRPRVRLNEILADNAAAAPHEDTFPDLIELFNEAAAPVDLSGMGLSDKATEPYRFAFPPGTILGAGAFLVVFGDRDTNTSGLHLGFGLSRAGDALYLSDAPSRGGAVLDSVRFGGQARDRSIGRGANGEWALTLPTFGAVNVPAPLGDARTLRLNEWLAEGGPVMAEDFIELFNPHPLPVALEGMALTDRLVGWPDRHRFAPLSFVSGGGYAVFMADRQPERGPDRLDFALAPEGGMIALLSPELEPIDLVYYGPQRSGVAEGRSPNGSARFAFFSPPTPGGVNPGATVNTNVTTLTLPLVSFNHVWHYTEAGDPGTNWYAADFDELAWATGPAPLGRDTDTLPLPLNTPLTLGRTTYYFRTRFVFPTHTAGFRLRAQTYIDDGLILYLNGAPVLTNGLSATQPITDSSYASRTVGDADIEGPFELESARLQTGTNTLAAAVHQANRNSSDLVFALALTAERTYTNLAPDALSVVLNEVLARPAAARGDGPATDFLELFNPADTAADLADASLSDLAANPRRFVFPAGVSIPPHGYWVLACDPLSPVSATNTGFGLASEGGGVYLFQPLARASTPLDALTYGLQLPGFSLGRHPDGTGAWGLGRPSPGFTNQAQALGDPARLRINEWMANPSAGDDWFELFNPEPHPVALGGLHLTDDLARRTQHRIAPRSFIGFGPEAYTLFHADNALDRGAHHVNFRLSAGGEILGLFGPEGEQIDVVSFGAQRLDVSQGRYPDGSANFVAFPGTPSPGRANSAPGWPPVDDDADGLPDDWERQFFGHLDAPPDGDADGDGLTNRDEFLAGTSPVDARSGLFVAIAGLDAAGVRVRIPVSAGRTYTVEVRDSLTAGAWTVWRTLAATTPHEAEFLDAWPGPGTARFYRVVLRPTP